MTDIARRGPECPSKFGGCDGLLLFNIEGDQNHRFEISTVIDLQALPELSPNGVMCRAHRKNQTLFQRIQ